MLTSFMVFLLDLDNLGSLPKLELYLNLHRKWRRCKIRAPCCNEVFNCRHCHNEAKNSLDVDPIERHMIPRHDVNKVICSLCNTEQDVHQNCSNCGVCMGNYFCENCKFFDDNHYNFAYMGEHLTKRIRIQVLDKILTFEPAWFDEEVNSSGALCSRLSNEASLVKTLVADRVSLMVQTSSSIIIAMTMGLIISWKLALVMIAVQPLSILCYYAKKVVLSNVSSDLARAQNQSTQIAVEAVYNHKMVTSFGCESRILRLFEEAQEEPLKEARKKSWIAGFAMGCSPCLAFMSWGLDFWYGGKLCEAGEISAGDNFKTFFILVISTGRVIAEAGSMTSDLAKEGKAVASIFEVLDRGSLIPGYSSVSVYLPTRPQTLVLREFSLEVKTGSSIGIAGMSGCGKSTIIGLIQRFYDVEKGVVRIDGEDIKELDIVWYRGFTGIVSQEPVMFAGSVRDNIAFGKPDADEEEIVKAARDANAHDFISYLF